jgi:hypothetical protein
VHSRPPTGKSRRHILFGWVSVVAIAAIGVFAGIATGEHGSYRPGVPRFEEPGAGAVYVGAGAGGLAFLFLIVANQWWQWRHGRNRGFRGLSSSRYMTFTRSLGRIALVALIFVAMIGGGLWLRHRYG